MAESSSSMVPFSPIHQQFHQTLPLTTEPAPRPSSKDSPSIIVIDKTLVSMANLVKLLPCCTVFAFEALSPSFTNHGTCYTSNLYLTAILILLSTLSCFFLSFTDSLIGSDGKLYHGIATFKGFYIFNAEVGERLKIMTDGDGKELSKLRLRFVDFVHAFFSCFVFLALAFSKFEVQTCFIRRGGVNTKELLVNLPLGIGFLSSLVFMIFPTRRNGVGYTNSTHSSART